MGLKLIVHQAAKKVLYSIWVR